MVLDALDGIHGNNHPSSFPITVGKITLSPIPYFARWTAYFMSSTVTTSFPTKESTGFYWLDIALIT
jgi:hypothetical protein